MEQSKIKFSKENTEFISIGKIEAIFEEDKILFKPNLDLGIFDLDNIFFNSNHIAIGYLDLLLK